MATAVKLPETIISEAKIEKIAEEDPDLSYEFIKSILIAQDEVKIGKLEDYVCLA